MTALHRLAFVAACLSALCGGCEGQRAGALLDLLLAILVAGALVVVFLTTVVSMLVFFSDGDDE